MRRYQSSKCRWASVSFQTLTLLNTREPRTGFFSFEKRKSAGVNGAATYTRPKAVVRLSHENPAVESLRIPNAISPRMGNSLPKEMVEGVRQKRVRVRLLLCSQEVSDALHPFSQYQRRSCTHPDRNTSEHHYCSRRAGTQNRIELQDQTPVQVRAGDIH